MVRWGKVTFGALSRWAPYGALVALVSGSAASACDSATESHGPPERITSQGGAGGQATAPSVGGSIHITPAVPHCGDGTLDPDETCDDGNRFDGDGCSTVCSVEPGAHCPPAGPCNHGDGRLDRHEQCDDGNTAAGDGCAPDGTLEDGWVCPLPGKPCRVRCGDGETTPPETCDDGNTKSGDGCARNCRLEPLCGATSGPSDSAGSAGAGGEASACAQAVCGDGIVSGDEQCDYGAQNLGLYGGCLSTCAFATYCGDGIVDADAGEQCDDRYNLLDYGESGCGPGCRLPHFCGDGFIDAEYGEMCDQSPGCRRDCLLHI